MALFHSSLIGLLVLASLLAMTMAKKGMTWGRVSHISGVDRISCTANAVACNAYVGDTECATFLPILCINQDGSSKPAGLATDFYNGWASGNVALTIHVKGSDLTSLSVANMLCSTQLGSGWRIAEHHDGSGGWGWQAYGNVRNDTRYWTYINDQPGNCWN